MNVHQCIHSHGISIQKITRITKCLIVTGAWYNGWQAHNAQIRYPVAVQKFTGGNTAEKMHRVHFVGLSDTPRVPNGRNAS
jgi:hypothetical protein